MGRHLASFIIAVGIAVMCTLGVSAETTGFFSLRFQSNSVRPGETVKLVLSANSNNLTENIAGFRVLLHYDEDKLIFKRAETADQIKSGTFSCQDWGGKIMGTYVCDGKSAPKLRGNCISFVFAVREDVSGKAQASAEVYEIIDWSENFLTDDPERNLSVTIKEPDPAEAFLTRLEPSTGELSPPFSSDTYNYFLEVDSSVTAVDFDTSAEGASVKFSRRTLQKAGEDTRIVITVTSEDKTEKTEYVVTVRRALPVDSEPESSSVVSESQQPEDVGGMLSSAATESESGQNVDHGQSGGALYQPAESKAEIPLESNIAKTENTGAETATGQMVNVYGDRNLYIVGNQMDAFAVGVLSALFCMLLGGGLLPLLKKKQK